jgi:diphthine-ammonia ligase
MPSRRPRAAVSWSGGKDSCAALARAREEFDVEAMITMCDDEAGRSRSHGLRPDVLDAQANRLGLARITARCTWADYDTAFTGALEQAAARGITHVIFGDILFEEHRRWAERICAGCGLSAVEPLWGMSTDVLFEEWVSSDSEAVIVTARAEHLSESWLGRVLHRNIYAELRRLGVDACGERGEYHTLVTNSPLFRAPLRWRSVGHVLRSGCWALDVAVDP